MVKTLHVVLDNSDYAKLTRAKEKSGLGWREFLLSLVEESE